MADALAGITAAIECVSLCIKAISVLRNFSASVKDAENELASIIHLVEKARNRVELIKVILLELRGANYPGVAAGFLGASDNLKLTLGDIMLLTSNVVSGESRLGIAKRIKWVMNKSKAQGLIKRLQSQERDIAQEFTLVNSSVSPPCWPCRVFIIVLYVETDSAEGSPPFARRDRSTGLRALPKGRLKFAWLSPIFRFRPGERRPRLLVPW